MSWNLRGCARFEKVQFLEWIALPHPDGLSGRTLQKTFDVLLQIMYNHLVMKPIGYTQ